MGSKESIMQNYKKTLRRSKVNYFVWNVTKIFIPELKTCCNYLYLQGCSLFLNEIVLIIVRIIQNSIEILQM